ncbi:uncharacterized protein NEMAJ01_1813 [Nematocida major]|uniref:uncharacterized protein n=1 Tax=Nematocida major TaxID=1912982 RepID=UPI002007A8DB|nr:uncharacterized protein NEMAJ01_1813 [Nematocida major]KAH9386917.1 hypothetical protein NEMAJ01_1813 [Nematocida major]
MEHPRRSKTDKIFSSSALQHCEGGRPAVLQKMVEALGGAVQESVGEARITRAPEESAIFFPAEENRALQEVLAGTVKEMEEFLHSPEFANSVRAYAVPAYNQALLELSGSSPDAAGNRKNLLHLKKVKKHVYQMMKTSAGFLELVIFQKVIALSEYLKFHEKIEALSLTGTPLLSSALWEKFSPNFSMEKVEERKKEIQNLDRELEGFFSWEESLWGGEACRNRKGGERSEVTLLTCEKLQKKVLEYAGERIKGLIDEKLANLSRGGSKPTETRDSSVEKGLSSGKLSRSSVFREEGEELLRGSIYSGYSGFGIRSCDLIRKQTADCELVADILASLEEEEKSIEDLWGRFDSAQRENAYLFRHTEELQKYKVHLEMYEQRFRTRRISVMDSLNLLEAAADEACQKALKWKIGEPEKTGFSQKGNVHLKEILARNPALFLTDAVESARFKIRQIDALIQAVSMQRPGELECEYVFRLSPNNPNQNFSECPSSSLEITEIDARIHAHELSLSFLSKRITQMKSKENYTKSLVDLEGFETNEYSFIEGIISLKEQRERKTCEMGESPNNPAYREIGSRSRILELVQHKALLQCKIESFKEELKRTEKLSDLERKEWVIEQVIKKAPEIFFSPDMASSFLEFKKAVPDVLSRAERTRENEKTREKTERRASVISAVQKTLIAIVFVLGAVSAGTAYARISGE